MFEDNAWDNGFYDDVEEYDGSCFYDDLDSSCFGGDDSDLFHTDYCIYTDPIDIDEYAPYELDAFIINSTNGLPMLEMEKY